MKRTLCILLALILTSICALSSSAATADVSGEGKTVVEYGDWIIEKIENDTYWNLVSYVGSGGEVIVPRFINKLLVVSMEHHCFANNKTVSSVITSSPMWDIGDYAFIDCTSLESFECHYALKTIGVGAFSGTSSLTDINLETSIITTVSDYAFADSGLIQVSLPETCVTIGDYAFVRCASLAKITIPDSVTEIEDTAFNECDALVIYCKTDSYAHEYAEANGIEYVLIDAPYEVTFMLGDADGDGIITIMDATKIQRLLAELIEDPDGMIALRGDCNGGGLDILDATKVQRWLADLEVAESIGDYTTVTITPTV